MQTTTLLALGRSGGGW